MKVRIITDSAADISRDQYPELTIIPMTVTFAGRQFHDGVDLNHKQFYELLVEEEIMPITSQINPATFETVFREAVDNGEYVVAILISSKLSGTVQSACIAADEFKDKVFVVDSLNATIGERLLVERALGLARDGLSAKEIAETLDREKHEIRLVALLDTLEYLKKGGRLSAATAMVGGLLSIKPVVAIKDGEVVVLGKARGSKNGNNLLIQQINSTSGIDFNRPYCLGYSGFSDTILQKYISDSTSLWEGHVSELPISTIGGTIGTHVGPGAIAVAFFCRQT